MPDTSECNFIFETYGDAEHGITIYIYCKPHRWESKEMEAPEDVVEAIELHTNEVWNA